MEDPRQPLLFHDKKYETERVNPSPRYSSNLQTNDNEASPSPSSTPYQQTYGGGGAYDYQQEAYAENHEPFPAPSNDLQHPQYLHGYGVPPPPLPDPAQDNVVYQPPRIENYPLPDSINSPGTPIPKPMMKIETNYRLALCLCIIWAVLLMWPAMIFAAPALCFAIRSRRNLQTESFDKARKNGRSACFCSVCSLVAALLYLVLLGASAYTVFLMRNALWGATSTNNVQID